MGHEFEAIRDERVAEYNQSAEVKDCVPNVPDNDPRKAVRAALIYIRHNLDRMDYPQYRRKGFPVTSCYVESLVKEFNFRVKATGKFWVKPSLEAVLQVRAVCLSDDQQWETFWNTRAKRLAASHRPYHARAA